MAFQAHAKRTLSQDSEFPHTFSWSTSPETIKGQELYAQSIPSDIMRFDDLETVYDPTSPMTAILDQTTLDVGFDHSCLGGLEYQLIFFPADAFAAVCWAEAVDEPAGPLPDHLLSRMPATSEDWVDRCGMSSDESEPDTDECRTFNEDTVAPLHIQICGDILDSHATKPSPIETKDYYASFDPSEQLITLKTRFAPFDPAESIGLFPVPNHRQRVTKTTGIAALRAYLPRRRKNLSQPTN